MDNNQKFITHRLAHRDKAFFFAGVQRIVNGQREWVSEYSGGFLEGDAMLLDILPRFAFIPLEPQAHAA